MSDGCGCSLCKTAETGQPVAIELRCQGQHPRRPGKRCNALLAEMVAPPYSLKCGRCGFTNRHVA